MKILLKRNQTSSSSLPSSLNVGEPLWFRDKLYIGSVGTSAGGAVAAGTPVKIATSVTGASELELSTTAQTYLTVDGTAYKLKLPASAANHNQTVSSKNGTASAVTFGTDDVVQLTSGKGISVIGNATNKTITFDHTNEVTGQNNLGGTSDETPGYGGSFFVPYLSYDSNGHITAAGTKTVTIPASDNTNQTITAKNGTASSVTTFGANAAVEIAAGDNISITTSTNKITIANTYSYTHPTYTAVTATGGLSGSSLTIPIIARDSTGHIGSLNSTTLQFNTAPTASNKIATMSDLNSAIGNLSGALVYKGTSNGTVSNGVLNGPSGLTAETGYVVVMAANATIVPSGGSGTETTLAGKKIQTNGDTTLETGDMLIYNGSEWNVVSGEGNVSNLSATLAWNTSVELAAVDGVKITATLPPNPNTDTSVTSAANHYTPATDSSSSLTKNASGGTAAWGIDVVTGVTLSRDSKGHVTGLSVSSGKLPANPDTNTTLSGLAYSSTAAGTAAKVATMPGFALSSGQRILLYLANSSTVANATLNVNSTTAKTVRISGANTTASNFTSGWWVCNYDGTYWQATRLSVAYSDITGTPTIPTVNTGKLKVAAGSGTTQTVYTGNQSSDTTLTISGGTNITTSVASGTTVTVNHAAGASAGASKTSIGGVSSNTLTIPIVSTDAQGHVSSLTTATWTYSAPASPGNGALKLGGTATGFTANTGSDTNIKLSATATYGNFSYTTAEGLQLTEIDGGLID